jgi:hypothetical protein
MDIVSFALDEEVGVDTLRTYLSYSLEWINESQLTYLTATVVQGALKKIYVWKYIIGSSGPRIICSFDIILESNVDFDQETSKCKVHLYGRNVIVVEDHRVYINPNKGLEVLYRSDGKSEIIVDAIMVWK